MSNNPDVVASVAASNASLTATAQLVKSSPKVKLSSECHHYGHHPVFGINDVDIFAGKITSLKYNLRFFDIFLGLTGGDDRLMESPILANSEAQPLLDELMEGVKVASPKIITIEWPDYGVPPVSKEFWQNLYKYLRDIDGYTAFGVACLGGHGRTGTALAILRGLSDPSIVNPVEWVRENYCECSVETEEQFNYVFSSMGIPRKEWPKYTEPVRSLFSYGGKVNVS